MEGLGSHLIAELFDCNAQSISKAKNVEKILLKAAELARTTVVKHFFHEFSPYGVSGVLIIAESHFTVHTWPEFAYAAVDIFTCGDIDYQPAIDYIKEQFQAGKCSVFHFTRGIIPDIDLKKEMFKWREIESTRFAENN